MQNTKQARIYYLLEVQQYETLNFTIKTNRDK